MRAADLDLAKMGAEVYEVNVANGWRENPDEPDPTFRECMALLMTEIMEAADAWRKWGFEDATPHPVTIADGPEPVRVGLPKPEGVGSELADTLIRLLDDLHVFGMQIDPAYIPRIGAVPESFLEKCFELAATAVRAEIAWNACGRGYTASVLAALLHQLLIYSECCGIDLMAEYERKLAYNRTRGYRHGGKRM